MKSVKIITDGACIGNPGPGGWACILRYGEQKREIFGWASHTTNNRMELTAAIEGFKALREPCEVEVVTDSEYLRNGITSWIQNWKRRDWLTKEKKPVVNRDLWEELDDIMAGHKTEWSWTRGHSSNEDNNRADELASQAARNRISSKST